ncbi:hypothetical protein [Haloarcula salina]|uniref:Uncharacterized protein n=1 Tax=Haloarcula salina TaxID=1429914 RepID=A0AA41KHW5_9EURY|nr:hypothetical protein [Haloarcula salina]MBV0901028.1 hypothetical protein [Haloarcula salina]
MSSAESQRRLVILVIGLVVLFAPALFVVATLEFLILTGDLALSQISLVEFLELYLIDLLLFVVLGYGVYRLTFWLIDNRLPAALDTLEGEAEPSDAADGTNDTGAVRDDGS